MPREERIEAILAAWYEFDECEPSEKPKWRDQRNSLIEAAIAGTPCSRRELLEALGPRLLNYRLARRKEHQAKMAQILRGL